MEKELSWGDWAQDQQKGHSRPTEPNPLVEGPHGLLTAWHKGSCRLGNSVVIAGEKESRWILNTGNSGKTCNTAYKQMLLSRRMAGVKPLTIQAPDAYREDLGAGKKR